LLQTTVEPGGTTIVEAGCGGGGLLLLMQPASKAAEPSKTNQRNMRNAFQIEPK
jgi:hypothetical protein